jgi:hypothetical protein
VRTGKNVEEALVGLEDHYANRMDADEARSRIEGFTQKGSELRAADIQEQKKLFRENTENGIFVGATRAMGDELDRQAAIDYVDNSTNELVEQGLIDDAEAIQMQMDIINDVANWSQERIAETKKTEKETTDQIYDGFMDKLVNGEMVAQEISNSSLNQTLKDKWADIAIGTTDPSPSRNEYSGNKELEGFDGTMDTVLAFSTGAISKQDAYERIATNRYVDRTITDEVFKFAVDKIQNKLPQSYAESLKGLLDTIEADAFKTGGLGRTDWEEDLSVKAQTAVVDFAETYFKENGKYPSSDLLYEEARKVGVSIRSQRKVASFSDILSQEKKAQDVVTGEIPAPTTQTEYDAIPSGTVYIHPTKGKVIKE